VVTTTIAKSEEVLTCFDLALIHELTPEFDS
jgi:hypothetical protein